MFLWLNQSHRTSRCERLPFGGNGESGVGREGTEADIDAMTEWKWITIQS
jgi:acyl-CoA reductase-like NAD-dependent aldehyde dehydrogenase